MRNKFNKEKNINLVRNNLSLIQKMILYKLRNLLKQKALISMRLLWVVCFQMKLFLIKSINNKIHTVEGLKSSTK